MTPQAQLVMLAWLPIVLYLFRRFPAQRAIAIGFIVAWLFLPQRAGFSLPGLPDYERMSATCYSILLATFLYHARRFSSFRFGWLDVPMVIVCLCPFFSSLANDLGAYDGMSAALDQTVAYGIPFFLGRIYLNNLAGLRQLAMAMLFGALVYVPLCLYEVRMSPQLHAMVYGYLGNQSFVQSIRLGGFRPTVFMRHGLSVGMWMMAGTLIAIWLWQSGAIKKIWNIPIKWVASILLVTFILIKSTGAYIYLAYGLLALFTAKWFRTALPLSLLIVSITFYLFVGVSGSFGPEQVTQVVSFAEQVTGEERAQSLQFRLDNEQSLSQRAREKMVFGWGGWGRNRVYDYDWKGDPIDTSTTDSLWIIAFGVNGIVGLVAVFASTLLPALAFFRSRYSASLWLKPEVAPAAVLSVVTVLYSLDCTLNYQANPVFILASGGIAGLVMQNSNISNFQKRNT
jgi:hypothetical protein